MKHLLTLLLLVAINCKAQTTYTFQNKSSAMCFSVSDSGLIKIYDTACTISWLLDKQLKSTIQVSDFMEYEEVCYNDSIVSYFYTLSDMGKSWNVPCDPKVNKNAIIPYCSAHWKHKTPTFEGFLLFISKRRSLPSR